MTDHDTPPPALDVGLQTAAGGALMSGLGCWKCMVRSDVDTLGLCPPCRRLLTSDPPP